MIIEEINKGRNEEHKKQAERKWFVSRKNALMPKRKQVLIKSVARPKRISGKRMIFFAFQNTFDKEFNGGTYGHQFQIKRNKFHHWEKLLDVGG